MVSDSQFLELVQYPADLFIHCLHHGPIDGMTLTDAHLALLLCRPDLFLRPKFPLVGIQYSFPLGLVFCYQVVAALKWSVNRIEGQIEQERLVSVSVQEFQRLIGQDLGMV